MNLWPVIERELACEARNAANYWLRLIGASALLFVGGLYLLENAGAPTNQGTQLFARMNRVVLLTIFVLVPVLAADSVVREKREGTLGLLFLTPLRARDIVVGKSLIHGLRATTILIATLPMLCIPLTMGGVSAAVLIGTANINASAIMVALAAGIHASVRHTEWIRAVAHALTLSFCLSLPFWTCASPTGFRFPGAIFIALSCVMLLAASLVLWRFIESSATWLTVNWRRELTRPPVPSWVSLFANSPFWRWVFSWDRTKTLDRNPIAWLQEHSWTARLTKWGWLVVILGGVLGGGCFAGPFMNFTSWLNGLTLALVAGVAFTATNTFRQEQITGALELLLVTPLTAQQIVRGRLWGLIAHFLPATLLLAFFWFTPAFLWRGIPGSIGQNCWFSFSTLVTIPLVGFQFAFRPLHFVTAWLLTLFTGYLLPMAIVFFIRLIGGSDPFATWLGLSFFTLYQLALALACYRRLKRTLDDRTFTMHLG